MKRIFVTIVLLCSLRLISQDCVNVLSDNIHNTINLSFEMPHYYIIDTIIPYNMGVLQRFSYINIDDNDFGVIDSLGFPVLPYMPINIVVPRNASNYRITLDSIKFEYIKIQDYIMPAQSDVSKDSSVYSFAMDTNFYTSNRAFHRLNVEIENEYFMFGEKGLTISLIPFEYNPNNDYIKIMKSANIRVSYDMFGNNFHTRRYTNTTENYLSNHFYNYKEDRSNISKENYLIITHPEFTDAIEYFANYKRNIGFNVDVVSADVIGGNSTSIKSFIMSRYKHANTRPEYILFVGDIDMIPVSGGSSDDKNNPYTDIEYSLIDGEILKPMYL